MRVLKFQVGEDAFAVDSQHIVEVTPLAKLRPLAHAPDFLAGLLHYRGRVVPVVSVSRLLGAVAAKPRLSTRIILVQPGPDRPLLGLLAERVSDLKQTSADLTAAPALAVLAAPYLGPVVEIEGELLQLLAVDKLPAVLSALSPAVLEPS